MSEILQRIERYIKETEIPRNEKTRYDLKTKELFEIRAVESPIESTVLAFEYGMAKGYRAGKQATK